jgi:hypothetical protein
MSASMSMAPFCAAAFSIFLMMSVSIRRSKGRRVGRPAGATDADGAFYGEGLPEPDSVASSLVDLGVLLNSGRLGPALVRTEPDSESVGQRLEAFERRDEQQEIADEG